MELTKTEEVLASAMLLLSPVSSIADGFGDGFGAGLGAGVGFGAGFGATVGFGAVTGLDAVLPAYHTMKLQSNGLVYKISHFRRHLVNRLLNPNRLKHYQNSVHLDLH